MALGLASEPARALAAGPRALARALQAQAPPGLRESAVLASEPARELAAERWASARELQPEAPPGLQWLPRQAMFTEVAAGADMHAPLYPCSISSTPVSGSS